jgi:hypothetical protein
MASDGARKRAIFQRQVQSCIQGMQGGQHLRFIQNAYRTREVCLAALRHETSHSARPYDIHSVPVALMDDVVAVIKAETPGNTRLHTHLDNAVADRKEHAAQPGYFDEPFTCAQDVMDHYGASNWDDMLERSFVKSCVDEQDGVLCAVLGE